MKLTPEQKVFIEYGKAKKALEIAKKQLAKEVPRMPCMEKQPTMPGSRLENGKFHNKRA